jgi:hypothetical protein
MRRKRWATTLLGSILVAQGAGKLLSPSGYFQALERFRILPAIPLIGSIWIALELLAGLGLLAAGLVKTPSRRFVPFAAIALLLQLAYAFLSISAYVRGLEITNCTCFGIYLAQRLSWFVLVQDAYMIAYAGWQLIKIAR